MRTTLTVDDELMEGLRELAHRRRLPLRQVVNQALRAGLATLEKGASRSGYVCPTFHLGPPRHGVNLDKMLALADTMIDEEMLRKIALRK